MGGRTAFNGRVPKACPPWALVPIRELVIDAILCKGEADKPSEPPDSLPKNDTVSETMGLDIQTDVENWILQKFRSNERKKILVCRQ